MRVTAKRNLNVRKSADISQDANGILLSGNSVEVIHSVTGQSIAGNSLWYTDERGNYYWSGGLNVTAPLVPTQLPGFADHWWFTKYGIDRIWKHTRGENANVVILDTGIDVKNPDFAGAIKESENFSDLGEGIEDRDEKSHGTRCSGIIAARGNSKIIGVAPSCNLYVGRILNDSNGGGSDLSNIVKAFDWAMSVKADIISISQVVFDENNLVRNKLNELGVSEKVLICASVGNGGRPAPANYFPSSYPSCLSVGAVDEFGKKTPRSNSSEFLDILSPGDHILTTDKSSGSYEMSDTSIATAYTSGVLALLVSYCKPRNIPISRVQKSILSTATPFGDPGWDPQSGNGIINPIKAFNNLSNLNL